MAGSLIHSLHIVAWLQRLHAEHPILFDLLAVGIGLVLFGVAMLLKWLSQF